MQKKNIKSTDFTLWEIEFEISKSYNRDDFSFEDAKKDFEQKLIMFLCLKMDTSLLRFSL